MKKPDDIAIVGMSCIFPGAGDVNTYWNNIKNKVDAISNVPENRWESIYYDPNANAIDRFYCRRGGFIDEFAEFDPIEFGIVPITVEGTEPDHLLALKMAKIALTDAGVFDKGISLDNTGIILGKGNYMGTGITRLVEMLRTSEHLVNLLAATIPDLAPSELEKIKKGFQKQSGRFGADTAMGLIPNLAASLVANRLDLGGTAYTVDAACASSLIAVDHAVQELNTGRCDMVLAGGIHLCQNVTFYSVFTQLGALSKNQQIRPFDQSADGLLIGEGCGMVVLKRLEDALKDDDRIYAVIKGVGVASDGGSASLMSPAVSGQAKAIKQAWDKSKVDYTGVGYIEAHGTGTPLGDKTEIETLTSVFGPKNGTPRAGLGSVKSMIGHTMPAAGIAGLIKTTMALHHGIIPPTLHCESPLEDIKNSKFMTVQEATDWNQAELPRRAGVNAFGFGGINAHVVLEGFDAQPNSKIKNVYGVIGLIENEKDEVVLLARNTEEELIKALEGNETNIGSGDYKIAVFNPTEERVEKSIKIVKRGKPWRNRNDIWFTSKPLLADGGKIAFMFPGLDALAEGSIDSLAAYFGIPQLEHAESSPLVESGIKVFETSRVLDYALKQLKVSPDLIAGHSLGEWIGCFSSGISDERFVLKMLAQLDPNSISVPDVYFLVAGCGLDEISSVIEKVENVYLSHDNCPHQVIICGKEEGIQACRDILNESQVFNQILPFQSGFHSPFFEGYINQLRDKLDILTNIAQTPMWSATTVAPYPDNLDQIKELSLEHLVKPVRFRELTAKLYKQEGVRAFIQMGTGGLIGFTDDTLKGQEYLSIAATSSKRTGINQLQRVVASLFVDGADVEIGYCNTKKSKKKGTLMKLALGQPLVNEFEPIELGKNKDKLPLLIPSGELEKSMETHPVLKTFHDNFKSITLAQEEISNALLSKVVGAGTVNSKVLEPDTLEGVLQPSTLPADFEHPIELSLTAYPDLVDHAMYNQPEGWPHAEDIFPVVPMTMLIQLMMEAAIKASPKRNVVKLENVQAFKWTKVSEPIHTVMKGKWIDHYQVHVTLGDYAMADITLGTQFSTPDFDLQETSLGNPVPIPITEQEVYEKRYMFHGSAYKGIKKFKAMGDQGMQATIAPSTGKGSLLDNAGQLFGLWCHLAIPEDHVAFPVRIKEVKFFDDPMVQENEMECTCQLTKLDDDFAVCNMTLKQSGKTWATISAWQNKRLGFDKRLWDASSDVLKNYLSVEQIPSVFFFKDNYRRVTAWDFVKNRYFNKPEKDVYESLPLSKRKSWLMGKVAIKDAVRQKILEETGKRLFPAEITVKSDSVGKPLVDVDGHDGINVSLSHKGKLAIALASSKTSPGIDIEEVKDRGDGFLDISFFQEELDLIPEAEDTWVWATRFWTAKEAYGKSIGKGLQGNPKNYKIEKVDGTNLLIKNSWIQTKRYENYIIGWIS